MRYGKCATVVQLVISLRFLLRFLVQALLTRRTIVPQATLVVGIDVFLGRSITQRPVGGRIRLRFVLFSNAMEV